MHQGNNERSHPSVEEDQLQNPEFYLNGDRQMCVLNTNVVNETVQSPEKNSMQLRLCMKTPGYRNLVPIQCRSSNRNAIAMQKKEA